MVRADGKINQTVYITRKYVCRKIVCNFYLYVYVYVCACMYVCTYVCMYCVLFFVTHGWPWPFNAQDPLNVIPLQFFSGLIISIVVYNHIDEC